MNLEKVKHLFWAFFSAVGVIAFWAGVWDGLGNLSYLEYPWVSLVAGLAMLSVSGFFFKEFDPLGQAEKTVNDLMRKISSHPQKHEFHLRYHDRIKRKDVLYHAKYLAKVEKGFLVFLHKGKEIFVPIHRVREVLHKGKSYWRA